VAVVTGALGPDGAPEPALLPLVEVLTGALDPPDEEP
jgi:hypothetical protein